MKRASSKEDRGRETKDGSERRYQRPRLVCRGKLMPIVRTDTASAPPPPMGGFGP